ncbi:MAG TPA: hypothetical protein VK021_03450 [Flavobacteriaceae bacterium]|nr:hypothetical protein [Flavobacteriaceae bacterium]
MKKLQTYLKTLRLVLIPLTVIELVYLGVVLSDKKLWAKLDEFNTLWVIIIYHSIILMIILWLNWTKLPIKRKMKINNTYMVVFLGILGMWLWMPSSDDIDGLSNY